MEKKQINRGKYSGRPQAKRKTALLLAVSLALSASGSGLTGLRAMANPGQAARADNQTGSQTEKLTESRSPDQGQISIRTKEELAEFSRNCISESYSKGKLFVLEADVNLQGTDFKPAAVFAGTFDGQGHGIIGLSIRESGSNLGLFRYIQEGAQVKNLKVQGTVLPEGSRKNIGGIAGTNRGRIENCTFLGEVTAQETLGGIAGYNEETGVISGCENQAALTGNLKTGGIAGLNEGLVENCINRGEVNATDRGVTNESSGPLTLGNIDLEENIRVEKVNDGGGIAGLSSGAIRKCVNYGKVGYAHVGYNLGGIAGRQDGLIDGCTNYGLIQGRKDVGGIVGQFEPFVTVAYEEDMFQSLENQLDQLSDMGDSLSGLIEEAGDRASGNLDQVDDQLGKIKDIGRSYKDIYRDDGDQFSEETDRAIDNILDVLDRMDLSITSGRTDSHFKSARSCIRRIVTLRDELRKGYEGDIRDFQALKQWLADRYRKLEEMVSLGETLKEDLLYLALNLPADLAEGIETFDEDFDELHAESVNLTDAIRSNRDQVKEDLDSMDGEMTTQMDVLSDDMDALSDDLKDSKNRIRAQKNQIEDQIDQMRNTISDGIDRAREEKDLYEDVSDLESGNLEEGTVNGCSNQGTVSADYQAGGIAGIIGMETGLDPEQDLDVEEERTLNMTRNIKAIVFACRNQGSVTVKNDYTGGIVGKANSGALIRNQNYGDIMAQDGNYAGGITGSSAYVLRGNYNMCTVGGNDYVGGIAGWGTDILNNYSMVSLAGEEGEWKGSIAGSTDEEGVIQGNFYVEQGLGAIDGITYEGQAEGLSYEDFCGLEQMPGEFGLLTVTFMVEDRVIKTITCSYGSAVPEGEIPMVPQKDGYYYQWEEKDLSCITGNEKVHAIYKAWNTTIASSEDKMPALLAEANFYPGTKLILEEEVKAETAEDRAGLLESLGETTVPEGFRIAGKYRYSIIQPEGASLPEEITVHVLAGERAGSAQAGFLEQGEIRIADSRRDGDYLVFAMSGPGSFVVLEPEGHGRVWIAVFCAAAGIAGVWLILAKTLKGKKRKKEKRNQDKGEEKQEGKQEAKQEVKQKKADHEKENKDQADSANVKKGVGNLGGKKGNPVDGNR